MKRVILLTILLMLLLISIVSAEQICEEPLDIKEKCLIVTPVITCAGVYDYVIFNETNNTIETGNLTSYKAGTYYFNFSKQEGGYIIELCDGTTREIVVGGKNKMLASIIGICAYIFLLFFLASKLNTKDSSWFLKGGQVLLIVFGLLFMILIPTSFIFKNFELKFWTYVLWQIRVFVAYGLIGLVVYAFKKFDIKRKFRL